MVNLVDDENNIQFALTDVDTFEAVGTLSIEVQLANPSPLPYTVEYTTLDITATGDSTTTAGDYQIQGGQLQFAAGVTSRFINIPIRNDSTHEPDEDFQVVLSNPQGGIGMGPRDTLLVTILDNDPNPNSRPEVEPFGLEMAPNPTAGLLRLSWEQTPDALSLHNLNGQLLRNWSPERATTSLEIDLAELPDGLYILRLEGKQGVISRRVQLAR